MASKQLRHSSVLTTDADFLEDLQAAAEFVRSRLPPSDLAIVLGSGLQDFENKLSDTSVLSYADIPGMPLPKVAGHPGRFISGVLPGGRRIYCLAGRSHCYEGYSFLTVGFPPKLLALLGVKIFIATNAAGGGPGTLLSDTDDDKGAVEQMRPGVLMLISDHVNNLLRSPLEEARGLLVDQASGFRAGAAVYSERLRQIARSTYRALRRQGDESAAGVRLYEGVYACFSGPTYETVSEVRSAYETMHINAFGMSTAPDILLANACGMECLAISLITNMAAGISGASLSHSEVTETGTSSARSFETFVCALLAAIPAVEPVAADAALLLPPPADPPTPLPQPMPRSATAAQLDAAAASLRTALALPDTERLHAAFVFGPPHSDHAALASDGPVVPLASLPGFAPFTAAGRVATVSLRRHSGAVVALVDTREHLGFCTVESNFVVAVLHRLGVARLAFLLSAGAADAALTGSVVAVDDYFDVATIHSAGPAAPLQSTLRVAAAAPLPALSCAFYPGPSYPTHAELVLAVRSGLPLSAITFSHLISSAAAASLPLFAVATVDYAAPKTDHGLARPASAAATARAVEHCLNVCAARDADDTSSPLLPSSSVQHLVIGPRLPRPVHQGCYEAVVRQAEAVRQSLLAGVDGCPPLVLLDRSIGVDALPGLRLLNTFDFELGAELPAELSSCRLALAENQAGRQLLLLQAAPSENCGAPVGDLMHPLRVVASLRPPVAVSVARLYSSRELAPARLAAISDHVNRSGRNPLFGSNVAAWGERFFDVQSLYRRDLCAKMSQSVAKRLGQQHSDSLVVCYGLGPLAPTPATLAVLKTMHAHAWAFSHVPEHLVLHHMSVPVAALGLVCTASDHTVDAADVGAVVDDFLAFE